MMAAFKNRKEKRVAVNMRPTIQVLHHLDQRVFGGTKERNASPQMFVCFYQLHFPLDA